MSSRPSIHTSRFVYVKARAREEEKRATDGKIDGEGERWSERKRRNDHRDEELEGEIWWRRSTWERERRGPERERGLRRPPEASEVGRR